MTISLTTENGSIHDTGYALRAQLAQSLPKFVQPLLTHLTGMPLLNEQCPSRSRASVIAQTAVLFSIGLIISSIACIRGGWWLSVLPIGWLLTSGALICVRLTLHHAAEHVRLVKSRTLNTILRTLCSVIAITGDPVVETFDHNRNHHPLRKLMQDGDPTYEAQKALGFFAGGSAREVSQRFARTLANPWYYAMSFATFMKATFAGENRKHSFIALTIWLCVLGLVIPAIGWKGFGVAYLVPRIVWFQLFLSLNLAIEHHLPDGDVAKTSLSEYYSKSSATLCGERFPKSVSGQSRTSHALRVTYWTLRMLCYHLPVRIAVLPADNVAHDWHHRRPASADWANASFCRRDDAIRSGVPYCSQWGLFAAIRSNFEKAANS